MKVEPIPVGALIRWRLADTHDVVMDAGIGAIIGTDEPFENPEYSITRYRVLCTNGKILWFYQDEIELYVKDEV